MLYLTESNRWKWKARWRKFFKLKYKDILKYQNKKIKSFFNYHVHYIPYYRQLFKNIHLKFTDIKKVEDLKKLPFTEKKHISPTKKNPNKHFDFVIQPKKKYIEHYTHKIRFFSYTTKHLNYEYKPVHIHFTAGRSAAPVPFLHTQYDLDILRESGRRMMRFFRIKKNNSVINTFPFAPHLAFWHSYYALEHSGMLRFHTGGGKVLGTDRIIVSIQQTKATALIGMPSYVYHVLKTAQMQKKRISTLRYIVLGGESVSNNLVKSLKDISESLGSKNTAILTTYAFTEGKIAWPQSDDFSGYYLYPDLGFVEIIDPKTGEVLEPGERGEIVYTHLDTRGSSVVRYRTGDISKLIIEKDKRGYEIPRIDKEIQRISEYKDFKLSKVKGTFVNLNLLEPIMTSIPGILDWQAVIKKKNNDPLEVDEFLINVAIDRKKPGIDPLKTKSIIRQKIRDVFEITPIIQELKLDDLLQELGYERHLKEKRIVDLRK